MLSLLVLFFFTNKESMAVISTALWLLSWYLTLFNMIYFGPAIIGSLKHDVTARCQIFNQFQIWNRECMHRYTIWCICICLSIAEYHWIVDFCVFETWILDFDESTLGLLVFEHQLVEFGFLINSVLDSGY